MRGGFATNDLRYLPDSALLLIVLRPKNRQTEAFRRECETLDYHFKKTNEWRQTEPLP
jgi:hypothetical protein